MTRHVATLLALRFAPQVLDESKLPRRVEAQIYVEQQLWQRFGRTLEARGSGRWHRKLFGQNADTLALIHEWQAFVDQPTAMRGQLLSYFVDPRASVPGIADVFLFSRTAVQDRQPSFAAQELVSVYAQHLKLASAMAPTNVWMSVPLPKYGYDFQSKAIRFQPQGSDPSSSSRQTAAQPLEQADAGAGPGIDILRPFSYDMLPDRARGTVNYSFGRLEHAPQRTDSPTNGWREFLSSIGSSDNTLAWPTMLAADRQLRLSSFPVDVKVAEALAKRERAGPVSAGLIARVFMVVDGGDVASRKIDQNTTYRFSMLFARIRKVEIHGPDGELLTSIPASSLPTAAEFRAGETAAAMAKTEAQAAAAMAKTEAQAAAKDRARRERLEKSKERALQQSCRRQAARVNRDSNSKEYQDALNACLANAQ